jgi:hypothetical protein
MTDEIVSDLCSFLLLGFIDAARRSEYSALDVSGNGIREAICFQA